MKGENDGGSGGTTKIDPEEDEDSATKRKKKLGKADIFAEEGKEEFK